MRETFLSGGGTSVLMSGSEVTVRALDIAVEGRFHLSALEFPSTCYMSSEACLCGSEGLWLLIGFHHQEMGGKEERETETCTAPSPPFATEHQSSQEASWTGLLQSLVSTSSFPALPGEVTTLWYH